MGSLISVDGLLKQAEAGTLKLPTVPPRTRATSPIPFGSSAEPALPYVPPAQPRPPPPRANRPWPWMRSRTPTNRFQPRIRRRSKAAGAKSWKKSLAQKKSLEAILRDTHPKKLDEGTLVLACLGPFHQEQMAKPENKILVEKILEEETGRPIHLVPVLAGPAPVDPAKPNGPRAPKPLSVPKIDTKELEKEEPIVAAALKMFGGKIVEIKRTSPQNK